MKRRGKDKRDSATTSLLIGGAVLVVGGGLVAAVLLGSDDAKAADKPADKPAEKPPADDPPVKDPPADPPADDPPADPPADDPPAGLDPLWGATPLELRYEFERAEQAAGIPGLGRFMAVWGWGAFRAKKAPVTPLEALAISKANPSWCLKCQNSDPKEQQKSREALERVTKPKSEGGAYDKPWPMPDDFDGWSDGSTGLFDVLRGAQAHAGIHNGNFAPLVKQPATVLFRTDVQLYVGGWIVYRIVVREDLKVIKATPADTWSNVRACTASPVGYQELTAGKKTAGAAIAAQAKANFLMRAAELGIDLTLMPQPLPWTWPGAKEYWSRLGVLTQQANKPQQQAMQGPLQKAGDFSYRRVPAVKPGSPVVWMLHGLGGDVDQLLPLASGAPDAEFVFVSRGPSWIPNEKGSADQVAQQLGQAAQALLAQRSAINGQALRPWIVLGYSQGGAVAYMLAANNASSVVVVGAARLPKPPSLPLKPTTRIVAVQGGQDKTVPPADAETTADVFAAGGFKVVWELEPTAGHSLATLGAPLAEILASEINKLPVAPDPFPPKTAAVILPGGLLARVLDGAGLAAGAPLVVVLHGENNNEAQLLSLREAELASDARLVFVRSARGDGRWAPGADTEEFVAALQAAISLVAGGLADLRARFSPQRVVVVGYSEGAAVALGLAAQGLVDASLSIAGYLPPALAPVGQVPSWVYVLSGGQDKVITPAFAQQTAQLFQGKASQVTQQPIAAATHELGTLIAPTRTALDEILVEVV